MSQQIVAVGVAVVRFFFDHFIVRFGGVENPM
jgi:hypothetical protein